MNPNFIADWAGAGHRSDLDAREDNDADLYQEPPSRSVNLPAEIPDSQPDWPSHPTEIPDSQENPFQYDIDLPDQETADESTSFNTVDTEIIPGGTQLTKKAESPRYTLHRPGVNANGRLPIEATIYQLREGEEDMDEEPTQPSTQPFHDPRRRGNTSSLQGQDEADIICILMPTSLPAHEAVRLTANAAPQHILQNRVLSHISEEDENRVEDDNLMGDENPTEDEDPGEDPGRSSGEGPARDIALRFSSRVHNLCFGFVFGRNYKQCDLLLGDVNNKKFSNRHFRIFLQPNGVLMLEDTSTNGTILDGTVLRGAKGHAPDGFRQPMQTVAAGSIIELPTISSKGEVTLRFVVRIPLRDTYLDRYKQNLGTYLACIAQAERQQAVVRHAAAKGQTIAVPAVPMTTNLWPAQQDNTTPNGSLLAAGTSGNNHGLNWNGGGKYNVVSYLGSGAFAMVYKLSLKATGELFAVKEISKKKFIKDGILGEKFHNELNVMKTLRHPNIVQYIENYETKTHLFIIMELIAYGDLTNWTAAGTAMPEYMCTHVAFQILQALDYLHKCGITHRDIKPDNILMASDYPYVFKLSDFGLSKMVTGDETFLTTFCGTLLYCAPEVYPDYPRVKSGLPPVTKRTRATDGRQSGALPYKHSVDTWSLAAVLYHLICGRPPFQGTSGDQGSIMLHTVMNTPIDWEFPRQVGVSDPGVDFLQKMLVIEPALRTPIPALLQHSWVRVPHNKDQELDASQLSIADKDDDGDGLDLYDDAEDPRDPKRLRQIGVEDSNQGLWGEIYGQRFPNTTGSPLSMTHPPPPNRLFGEIGSSALRSSGVLGQNAHAALGVNTAGSYDVSSNASMYNFFYTGSASANPNTAASAPYSNADAAGEPYTAADFAPPHQHPQGTTQVQYPHLPSNTTRHSGAPSLFGAEALVGQLNMASPESGASAPSVDSKLSTPKSREMSPTIPGSKRPNEDAFSSKEDESTSKRSKVGRTQSSTQNHRPSGRPSAQHPGNKLQGTDSYHQEGQQLREQTKSNASLLPTAYNSHDSAQDSKEGDKTSNKGSSRPQSASSNKAVDKTAQAQAPSKATVPPALPATQPVGTSVGPKTSIDDSAAFAKPPIRFGNLIPTRGSIPTVPKIKIASRTTTYGRAKNSTFVHANGLEDRIPKNAIDIQMWYPGIEKDIAAGKDWATNPNLTAIISTRTSRYIKVNNIRLMTGKECWLYGRLKTGDIVSVFELVEGSVAKDEREKEFLRFRCEFFVGASKEVRKDGDKFVVETEKEKYNQFVARQSRESSLASEAAAESSKSPASSIGGGEASKSKSGTVAGPTSTSTPTTSRQ